MDAGEILSHMWELPWYKVAWIAIVDDYILLCKMWWLWAGIIVLGLVGAFLFSNPSKVK